MTTKKTTTKTEFLEKNPAFPRAQADNTEGEDVIFEPVVLADDELIETETAAAEKDIKAAVDIITEVETGEKRYVKKDPIVISALEKATSLEGAKMRFLANKLADEKADEEASANVMPETEAKEKSDGTTAGYYELPEGATELQHLISFKNMNGQMAEIFRANYRYGQVEHSEKLRDAKKIKYYIEAEIERLEKYESE